MTTSRFRTSSAVASVLLGGALLSGCGADETVVQEAQEEGPAAAAAILGEPVTLRAEVQEVINFHAFTVGESGTLVLSDTPATVTEGDQIEARGVVRQFIVPDFEAEFDWINTGTDPWPEEYEQDLVLVADAVEIVP